MNVWIREALGGLLLCAGLVIAGYCVWFLNQGYVIEGGLLVFLSLIVLGSGTHLMKVALAVRVLKEAQRTRRP